MKKRLISMYVAGLSTAAVIVSFSMQDTLLIFLNLLFLCINLCIGLSGEE